MEKTKKYLIIVLVIILAVIILAECDAENKLKENDTSAADTGITETNGSTAELPSETEPETEPETESETESESVGETTADPEA